MFYFFKTDVRTSETYSAPHQHSRIVKREGLTLTDDYDDDYYDLEEPINNCDAKRTVYDVGDDTCSHKDFQNLTRIGNLPGYSNESEHTLCCPPHGYLHIDYCKVKNVENFQ